MPLGINWRQVAIIVGTAAASGLVTAATLGVAIGRNVVFQQDMATVETDLEAEIAELEDDVDDDIGELKRDNELAQEKYERMLEQMASLNAKVDEVLRRLDAGEG